MAGESSKHNIQKKFSLIAQMLLRLMDPKSGLLYEGANRGANAIWPNSALVDKWLPEGQAISGEEGMMRELISLFYPLRKANKAIIGAGDYTSGGGLDGIYGAGFPAGEDVGSSLLEALSGQYTEGGTNSTEGGLLEALAGQMSSQDNASMIAASGLPTDYMKIGAGSARPQLSPQAASDWQMLQRLGSHFAGVGGGEGHFRFGGMGAGAGRGGPGEIDMGQFFGRGGGGGGGGGHGFYKF
jgi:hypothetical protein